MGKFIMVEPREPHLGYEPEPPKDYVEQHISIFIYKTITLQELIAKLPDGITADDLRFTSREWDSGCDCGSYTDIYYIKRSPNTRYKSEYKAYEKNLENFNQRKVIWEKEIEQFKLDVKEFLAWAKKENYWINEATYKELKKKYNIK